MEEVIKKIEAEIEYWKSIILRYGKNICIEEKNKGLQRAIEIIRENKEDK